MQEPSGVRTTRPKVGAGGSDRMGRAPALASRVRARARSRSRARARARSRVRARARSRVRARPTHIRRRGRRRRRPLPAVAARGERHHERRREGLPATVPHVELDAYASIGGQVHTRLPVAVRVVDAPDGRPELRARASTAPGTRPARASRGASTRSRRPPRRVWGACLSGLSSRGERAVLDRADLVADGDHRLAEAVELAPSARSRSARPSACPAMGKAHRRRVEAVVHEALGDVVDLDARRALDRRACRGCTRARRARACPGRRPGSAGARRSAT